MSNHRSKYSILTERAEKARAEAKAIEHQLAGLDLTPCGLRCGGCQAYLATEGDFARHFAVKQFDEINNLLNLGYCPVEKD